MATKKRKVDQEDDLLSAPNHHDSSDHKTPRQTLYFPIPDDAPAAAGDGDGDGDDYAGAEEEDEDLGKLLEPFPREQLISLLRSAAARDPRTLDEILSAADADPAHRKLFVHGLGWETTSEGLRAAFARYGEIEDCRVIVDKPSGRSKGYGFVQFRHRSSASRALREPQKLIDNRMTACQLASTGPTPHGHQQHNPSPNPLPNPSHSPNPNPNPSTTYSDNLPRKIYVANVHADIDGTRLYNFFAKFGEIEEGPLGFDRQTGKAKGFALFVYKTLEGAQKALEEPIKNFEGHLLQCQRATDGRNKAASGPMINPSGNEVVAAMNMPQSIAAYNGVVGMGGMTPDMGLAQQTALLNQGFLGMGAPQAFVQGMQPNAAMLAMLAAAGQNPAAFGFNPAVLASLNPAFAAAALGAGAQPTMAPSAVTQTSPIQGLGVGSIGYQTAGFQGGPPGFQGPSVLQGPPGFQGPPGYQGTTPVTQQGGAAGTAGVAPYQAGPAGQAQMPRPPIGHMGGYGQQH
ncbi:UBP1-associated protein 2B-like [Ananas comosus]|uniref:UBP1-associated protein 2B-like n=1 Tax=Ananas comosus TaxID=4615 RepID=A0A6P5FAB0_ANACO|nr:UBP1-associated protein 2B-like [Ananas comosus]